ncbi:MAG: CBS domain-containing protein [Thermoanaerobaculia bacterium]
MRVKEIMKRDVWTITPDQPLSAAAELMRIRGIRHLVVLQRGVTGVISNRDMVGISTGELAQVQVGDVMERHCVTITPESTIVQAANKMRGHKIGCLPVVENEKLVGIITTTDLLEQIARAPGPRRSVRDHGSKRRSLNG